MRQDFWKTQRGTYGGTARVGLRDAPCRPKSACPRLVGGWRHRPIRPGPVIHSDATHCSRSINRILRPKWGTSPHSVPVAAKRIPTATSPCAYPGRRDSTESAVVLDRWVTTSHACCGISEEISAARSKSVLTERSCRLQGRAWGAPATDSTNCTRSPCRIVAIERTEPHAVAPYREGASMRASPAGSYSTTPVRYRTFIACGRLERAVSPSCATVIASISGRGIETAASSSRASSAATVSTH